jgi:hypothetical protein
MGFTRAGSNPAVVVDYVRKFFLPGELAQSEERIVRNDEAPGSKPGFSNAIIFFFFFLLYEG